MQAQSALSGVRNEVPLRPNGAAMQALRTARKVSLREMHVLIGRDPGHLSRLERGLAGASAETIRRYAGALSVPTAAITYDR